MDTKWQEAYQLKMEEAAKMEINMKTEESSFRIATTWIKKVLSRTQREYYQHASKLQSGGVKQNVAYTSK